MRCPFVVGACLIAGVAIQATRGTPLPLAAQPQVSAAATTDSEFWRLVTEFSEPGGNFASQLMSNEDSAQHVMPGLEEVPTGGAYVGVGEEQNFTYLATLRPSIAFIVDIRRDNLIELLWYKAAIEQSPTRADFICRMFSKVKPASLTVSAPVEDLLAACDAAAASETLLDENLRVTVDRVAAIKGEPVAATDEALLRRMMTTFMSGGPSRMRGFGDRNQPTYADVMVAKDPTGRQRSFLASEDRYATIRQMQRENRIVPIVGNFAGDKALRAVGQYLDRRGLVVNAFYVSNVERYLFDQKVHDRFLANVRALPTSERSVFIRSIITDIAERLSIPIPVGPARWRTFLFPIRAGLARAEAGGLTSYRDLFTPGS